MGLSWSNWTQEQWDSWPVEMTLGEAIERLQPVPEDERVACACIGGPGCCMKSYRQAEALKRGAHIVARLVLDVSTRT